MHLSHTHTHTRSCLTRRFWCLTRDTAAHLLKCVKHFSKSSSCTDEIMFFVFTPKTFRSGMSLIKDCWSTKGVDGVLSLNVALENSQVCPLSMPLLWAGNDSNSLTNLYMTKQLKMNDRGPDYGYTTLVKGSSNCTSLYHAAHTVQYTAPPSFSLSLSGHVFLIIIHGYNNKRWVFSSVNRWAQ